MQTLSLRLLVFLALLLGALTVVGGIVVREPFERGVAWLGTTLDDPTAGAHLSVGPYYYFPNGRDYAWPAFQVPRQQFTVRVRDTWPDFPISFYKGSAPHREIPVRDPDAASHTRVRPLRYPFPLLAE